MVYLCLQFARILISSNPLWVEEKQRIVFKEGSPFLQIIDQRKHFLYLLFWNQNQKRMVTNMFFFKKTCMALIQDFTKKSRRAFFNQQIYLVSVMLGPSLPEAFPVASTDASQKRHRWRCLISIQVGANLAHVGVGCILLIYSSLAFVQAGQGSSYSPLPLDLSND